MKNQWWGKRFTNWKGCFVVDGDTQTTVLHMNVNVSDWQWVLFPVKCSLWPDSTCSCFQQLPSWPAPAYRTNGLTETVQVQTLVSCLPLIAKRVWSASCRAVFVHRAKSTCDIQHTSKGFSWLASQLPVQKSPSVFPWVYLLILRWMMVHSLMSIFLFDSRSPPVGLVEPRFLVVE